MGGLAPPARTDAGGAGRRAPAHTRLPASSCPAPARSGCRRPRPAPLRPGGGGSEPSAENGSARSPAGYEPAPGLVPHAAYEARQGAGNDSMPFQSSGSACTLLQEWVEGRVGSRLSGRRTEGTGGLKDWFSVFLWLSDHTPLRGSRSLRNLPEARACLVQASHQLWTGGKGVLHPT